MSESNRELILIGAGGHAVVVADAATLSEWNILGFYDDNASATLPGIKRLGAIEQALKEHEKVFFHATVGDGILRERWLDDVSLEFQATIIHPSSIVSETAQISEGVFVGPRAIVNPRARIGRGVIINSGAIIEHDCVIGDFSHIAPRSVLGGNVIIGEHSLIGIGATVLPGIVVGKHITAGGGAVVIEDLPDNITATGVPAKVTSRVY